MQALFGEYLCLHMYNNIYIQRIIEREYVCGHKQFSRDVMSLTMISRARERRGTLFGVGPVGVFKFRCVGYILNLFGERHDLYGVHTVNIVHLAYVVYNI